MTVRLANRLWAAVLLLVGACVLQLGAQPLPRGFQRLEFTVEGVARAALVYVPQSAHTTNAPVVFVFHGHGGNMRQAARSFHIEREWPEAICVYPQGLPTPGRLVDPEGKKSGWQGRAGDQSNRDLKFFDALLARLKRDYKVDEKRIYATGHSNGGVFTYLLWAERGNSFTAVAPSAAAFPIEARLTPKPDLHLAGEKDPLVKYSWQQATMQSIRRVNGCESEGKPWAERCTLYPSRTGTPVVTFIHPGEHEFHRDAPRLIVKFFKEHAR